MDDVKLADVVEIINKKAPCSPENCKRSQPEKEPESMSSTFYQNNEHLKDALRETARGYIAAGLSVVPTNLKTKKSVGKWKEFQTRIATEAEVNGWRSDSFAIVCGAVSGNLLCIDFDKEARLYDAWLSKIPPHLVEKFVIETTQRGGKHVVVRCEEPVGGNVKLACGFEMNANGKNELVEFIETRGEGGYFICAPNVDYTLIQGGFTALSVLTAAEVKLLLDVARSFDATPSKPEPQRKPQAVPATFTGDSPADDWNSRGRETFKMCLENHGWTYVYTSDENEHWRRPGKEDDGTSATLHLTEPLFYVFSTNASPFDENQAYNFFQAYAILEHGGDDSAAARQLLQDGYGGNTSHTVTVTSAPERKAYPLDVLHPKERRLVMEIAKAKNVAPDVVAITLDVVMSTLIGASHKVTVKSGWSEPGSIWAVIIADSGDGKTRVQSELLRPLFSLQGKWFQEYNEGLDAYEVALEQYKASVKKPTKNLPHHERATLPLRLQMREVVRPASGVTGLPAKSKVPENNPNPPRNDSAYQAAKNGIEPSGNTSKPQPPKRKDLFVIDTTIEALAERLTDNPHGLGNFNDEFRSLVTSFTRYAGRNGKSGGSEAHYLSLFDGNPIKIDRITRGGVFISNPFLSILGGIQPYVWRDLLRENISFLHSGFTARFIFLSPPALPTRWTDAEITESTRNFYEKYIGDYMILREQSDPASPRCHGLSQEAKTLLGNFYNENGEDKDSLDSSPLKASYSRVCGYALRIALRRHIANSILDNRDINEPITGDEMAAGIAFAEWAKNESARMLYEATGSATGVAGTTAAPAISNPDWADILRVIDRRDGKATPRDVARNGSRFREEGGTDRADAVLAEMTRAGIVTVKSEGGKLVYRRA